MSCGRPQCKRTFRGPPLFCRCGLEFCSEACFVSAWHAEHQFACPQASQIKEELETRKNSGLGERSGTGQLVAVALSRTRPADFGAQPQVQLPGPAAVSSIPPKGVDESPTKSGGGSPAAGSDGRTKDLLAAIQRWRQESADNFQTIGDPIGNGSYGQVTRVRHKKTGETYAMKAVPKQKIRDQGMLAYLMREIRTQMQLTHPCIVQLHYYFEDEHHVLLLLEYANGGSLFSLLRQHGQLPEAEAARYYVDVAMALMHLHKYGIVHRDLKPENILMCGEPPRKAKLADFGWCAELSRDGAPRNTFCGTWDYLSPEMVENQPHDSKVDIWATGVLLFEMLTGRAPFSAPSPAKATDRIRKVDLQVPGYVPPLAADLMQKLLVREPAKRIGLKDALKHNWIVLQVPGASLELTKSSADVALKQLLEPARPTPSKALQSVAATKEVTVDSESRGRPPTSSAAEALPESSPNTASPASTLSVAPVGARNRGYSDGDGSNHSVSSASTVQIPRPKPSVMPWSDHTPTSIKEGGSRSSSKEASDFGTPAEVKRGLDFGLPDTTKETDAFHMRQPDQLGFGFGICSRAGSKDSASSARLGGKEASPSSWHESETFAAVRDWLKSPTSIANDLGFDASRERAETEPSGILKDALSRTHGAKSFSTKEADVLSQTSFASSRPHADGRILPKPKQKMASPTASRRASAETLEKTSTDIMVFARQAKQQQPQPIATCESVDEETKCHNALDGLEDRLRRKWEAILAG